MLNVCAFSESHDCETRSRFNPSPSAPSRLQALLDTYGTCPLVAARCAGVFFMSFFASGDIPIAVRSSLTAPIFPPDAAKWRAVL